MSEFKNAVINAVKTVPYGKVASYSQIALMVGVPRAARQVGWILNSLEESILERKIELPWWRIINNKGVVTIKGTKFHDATLQKELLEKESISFNKLNKNMTNEFGEKVSSFTLDIEKYRFRPDIETLKKLQLSDEYVFMILDKYDI